MNSAPIPSTLQRGFTLIELMVVVVIVSIMLAVGMMSFGRNEASQIRQTTVQTQALLQGVCDQAAFNQGLYLLAVDEEGLTPYRQLKGEWVVADQISPLVWPPNLTVAWQTDPLQSKRLGIKDGWLCWPGGMVTPGSIWIEANQLSWNDSLRFELK